MGTTSNPTHIPTNDPTQEPTTEPTKYPTLIPTKGPTNEPTYIPTYIPTLSPSQKPTMKPTLVPSKSPGVSRTTEFDIISTMITLDAEVSKSPELEQYEQDKEVLDASYQIIIIIFMIIFFIIGFCAFLDANFLRKNDYFKITKITSIALQSADMLSDCFFAYNVSVRNNIDSKYLMPLILTISFILIPSALSLYQLYTHSKKHWLHSSDQVRGWLAKKNKNIVHIINIYW